MKHEEALLKKYPFIVETHRTSRRYYVVDLCKEAESEKQPFDVTYKRDDGTWCKAREYRNTLLINMFKDIAKQQKLKVELNELIHNDELFVRYALYACCNDYSVYLTLTDIIKRKLMQNMVINSSQFYKAVSDDFLLFLDNHSEHEELKKTLIDKSKSWKY